MKTSFKAFQFLILLLISVFTLLNKAVARSLSGHITDRATGDPLRNILVQLYRSDDPNLAGEGACIYVDPAFTNETGAYVFNNLGFMNISLVGNNTIGN